MDLLAGLKEFEKDFRLRLEISDLERNWKELFPRLDIRKQLVAANAWIISNRGKAPKAQKARFLNAWMRRAEEWAQSSPSYTEKFKPVEPLAPPTDIPQADLDEMHRQTVRALGPRMCKSEHCGVCGK